MRLTARRRALLSQALALAEEYVQVRADDARRLAGVADRLGVRDYRKAVEADARWANAKAREFAELRAEVEKDA